MKFFLISLATLVIFFIMYFRKVDKKITRTTIQNPVGEFPLNVITVNLQQPENNLEGTSDLKISYLTVQNDAKLNNLSTTKVNADLDVTINNSSVKENIVDKNQTVKRSQTVDIQEINDKQTVNGNVEVETIITESFNLLPSGVIMMWSDHNIPDGWVLCDGQNETPDLRGKFPISVSDTYKFNKSGGEENVTLTEKQIPKHSHTVHKHNAPGDRGKCAKMSGSYENNRHFANCPQDHKLNSTGGGQPHSNMPPYIVVNYIMKI